MTRLLLVWRSLRFHLRSHVGAVLGAAVGTTVLVGALVVGDSVRGSLRAMALARLGSTQLALPANDRFFRADLAKELTQDTSLPAAAVLQLQGTASASDGSARANRVQVLGVDDAFWALSPKPIPFAQPGPDEVILSRALAEQLKAQADDTVLLRVEKPARLSREAPITPQEDFAIALRVKVRAIATDDQLGRFSLQVSQVAPFNAFVSAAWLGDRVEKPRRANLMLTGSSASGTNLSDAAWNAALRRPWQLADAEMELRELPGNGGLELRTSRIFLDRPSIAAGRQAAPETSGVLTYFVNRLESKGHVTPYSMVTATDGPIVPKEMRDEEILINQWLAEDLQAGPGDALTASYFVIGSSRRLEERTNSFRIRAVLPMQGAAADPSLMPDFPGLEKAESTRDWDSSLPIQLDKIRPKDEEYWKEHRGTPKAFITLAAGQKMWTNRFGELTALRYPPGTESGPVAKRILAALDPASLGLSFQPVRQQALAAAEQSQDFGQLFLGFSFFLILAALLLMALLFRFGLEQRATEIGTLLAIGFRPKQVRQLFLWEGIGLALLGAALGIPGGIGYARAMLYGLSTVWQKAVGTSGLEYHVAGQTLAAGAVASVLVAAATIWLSLRKQARQPARQLLAEGASVELDGGPTGVRGRAVWIGWITGALALLTVGWGAMQRQPNSEVFFSAGALLLVSELAFASALLRAPQAFQANVAPTVTRMGLRNIKRRRSRSLAAIGLLACGSFLIASIGVFKLDANSNAEKRSSGTGGFAFVGETTVPVVQDLNSEGGRQFFGLDSPEFAPVRFVPFRVREGEDASCLNLNRAQKPRLLGVNPELLAEREAFTFSSVLDVPKGRNPWVLLNEPQPDGSVPAIGDAASIQWALGKKLGDTLEYTDDRGQRFKIRLVAAVANSILQGSLIISEHELLARFPSESGYRMFLVDGPSNAPQLRTIEERLARAMQDYGLQLVRASARLAALNAVQNTYLNTFQVLGGLGLILGSLGLGVIVLRNVLERRSELALLLATGFRPRAVRWMVLSEHGALLVAGLMAGLAAAFVAVIPALLVPGSELPVRSLALTLAGVLLTGLIWTWLAARLAVRGRLLDALRSE